jgi:hypothetical protein
MAPSVSYITHRLLKNSPICGRKALPAGQKGNVKLIMLRGLPIHGVWGKR